MADLALAFRRGSRPIPAPWLLAIAAAPLLFGAVVTTRPPLPGDAAGALETVLLWHSLVPRAVTALIAGAALGLSGMLLQRVLRNPVADPSTLGIASGAQLALAAATVFAPALLALSREGVALAGGIGALAIVLGLGWRRSLDPVIVVLSGMVVSLICAALSAAIVLAEGDYVMSLFIWGAGALHQQSWDTALALAPRLAAGFGAAALLLRPLAVIGLDDASARGLGVALVTTRLAVIGLAVWLAASVTAEVGIIGFVGLAAPALARAAGARTTRRMLLAAPVAGAVLLSITDSAVQLLGDGFSDLAPTGAATALLGAPLLLWLTLRERFGTGVPATSPAAPRASRPWRRIAVLTALAAGAAGLALFVGRDPDGWNIATGQPLADLLPFRWPRVAVAGAAGALLAAAGTLMQRLMGNPLAGPELLGVGAGGGVGLSAVLFLTGSPGPLLLALGIAGGSGAVLAALLAIAATARIGPERLLLAGVALGALAMAIVSAVLAQGDMRAYALLLWMAGSTDRAGPVEAAAGLVMVAVLVVPLVLLKRPLDLLPLGEGPSRALGLAVGRGRLIIAGIAAIQAAVASFLIGPLSLVGLIAPHLARVLGLARAGQHLAAAVVIGAGTMILADWLARLVIFPYQLPVGLFAALVGGPYLLVLLNRRGGLRE